MDTAAPQLRVVDLSRNPHYPSDAGYAHYSNLVARGVSVLLDWPETNDGAINVSGGLNAITFVTASRRPQMEIQNSAGAPARLVWHWGDGTITRGATQASHDFGAPGLYTNYVEVIPPECATRFGAMGYSTGQGITAVYGLANFPNLSFLYLDQESVTDLSLAGGHNLRQLHLAGNPVSVEVCDQGFIDLDNAVPVPVTGADFYSPATQRSYRSDAAWSSLVHKGYVMHPF